MDDSPIISSSQRMTTAEVLQRIAMPSFIFTGSLALLLILSWVFAVPRFTSFELGGSIVDVRTLREYATELQSELQILEQQRDESVIPSHTSLVRGLHAAVNPEPVALLFDRVEQVVDRFNIDGEVVDVNHLSFNATRSTIALDGRVINVGPRSMTVLAQLVDELSSLSGVSSLQGPSYTREVTTTGEQYSPFTIRLLFDSSAAL